MFSIKWSVQINKITLIKFSICVRGLAGIRSYSIDKRLKTPSCGIPVSKETEILKKNLTFRILTPCTDFSDICLTFDTEVNVCLTFDTEVKFVWQCGTVSYSNENGVFKMFRWRIGLWDCPRKVGGILLLTFSAS